MEPLEKEALEKIINIVENWSNCPFSHLKEGTLRRRVKRRLILTKRSSFRDYLNFLINNPKEIPYLFDSLTIKVSAFFRDKEVFETLYLKVMPIIVSLARDRGDGIIRMWSAACATGQETYSLAILAIEFLKNYRLTQEFSLSIIGSDVDEKAVNIARHGVYDKSDVKLALRDFPNYFQRVYDVKEERYGIAEELRSVVSFTHFNCASPCFNAPPGAVFFEYDLIMLRNILIYYDIKVREKIVSKMYNCLLERGFLVLGKSEVIPSRFKGYFLPFHKRHKIYFKET